MTRWLLLLAACGSSAAPPPPQAAPDPWASRPSPPAPTVDAAPADAPPADAPPDAPDIDALPGIATPTADDRVFQDHVRAFATKTTRHIDGWGTAPIAEPARPLRFATLSPIATDGTFTGATSGAYVLEESPTRYWLVTYFHNAASFHGDDAPETGEPPWVVTSDTAVLHSQMHNHGKTNIQFAFHRGALVLLGWDDYNTRLEPDSIDHQFAPCRLRCPLLATYKSFRGATLHVSAPAASIDALVEPPPID
ncbi:MAG TPA: hypothetical protein VGM88_24355 [Kofleriaceae bacterium]|jgi:hypothetical protein